jgi:hypothetical protein
MCRTRSQERNFYYQELSDLLNINGMGGCRAYNRALSRGITLAVLPALRSDTPTYLPPQLLVHPSDRPDQQLVAVVQRHLSVGHRLAEPRQVILGTEEVAQVQQQLEVRQLVGEGPAFLAHPTQFTTAKVTLGSVKQ